MPSGTLYDNDIVGAVANAIASNVAKLSPQVIRRDTSGMTVKNDRLSRLLTLRPCPEASTYDWLYKMTDTLVRTSNAFAVIFYNEDYTEVTRIQPVTVRNHRIFEDDAGNLLFRFVWDFDGQEYTVPYQFVIHLKSRYNKNDFWARPRIPNCAVRRNFWKQPTKAYAERCRVLQPCAGT